MGHCPTTITGNGSDNGWACGCKSFLSTPASAVPTETDGCPLKVALSATTAVSLRHIASPTPPSPNSWRQASASFPANTPTLVIWLISSRSPTPTQTPTPCANAMRKRSRWRASADLSSAHGPTVSPPVVLTIWKN